MSRIRPRPSWTRWSRLGRAGRVKGAGFYEYADGKRVGLWPGLRETFKSRRCQDSVAGHDGADAVRGGHRDAECLDEGVLTSTADANIGSIMGIGFPP